jgi:hypothetical protein
MRLGQRRRGLPELSESSAAESVTRTDDPGERVSWAELFFELVFVFAVTEVSALPRADEFWARVGRPFLMWPRSEHAVSYPAGSSVRDLLAEHLAGYDREEVRITGVGRDQAWISPWIDV